MKGRLSALWNHCSLDKGGTLRTLYVGINQSQADKYCMTSLVQGKASSVIQPIEMASGVMVVRS